MSSSISRNPLRNRILSALSQEEYARLLRGLEPAHLPQSKVVSEAGDTVEHAYFLLNGVASLLSITEGGETIEAAMVGNEGLLGIPMILKGGITPYRTIMQLPADAVRVKADVLRNEFERGAGLRDLLFRYTCSLLTQVSQSAVCNHFHKVEERLCRWLLIMHDRIQADSLHLTQEVISDMLGASRSSVTVAALNLQDAGIIHYRRGKITILDRGRLGTSACECYRIMTRGMEEALVT
jgi:CRP-like cAMP-binding protein